MGYEAVVDYFKQKNVDKEIILFEQSSATVELAAQALGRKPEEIAKSLAFKRKDGTVMVVVTCGTARIDNRKYKDNFGCKAVMLSFEDTLEATGHPVGGVCPFGLPENVEIYLDESLKRYSEIFPAAGTGNSAVRFTPAELGEVTGGKWIDVTQAPVDVTQASKE